MRIGIPLLHLPGPTLASHHMCCLHWCLAALAAMPATARPGVHLWLPEGHASALDQFKTLFPGLQAQLLPADLVENSPDPAAVKLDLRDIRGMDATHVDCLFHLPGQPPLPASVPTVGWAVGAWQTPWFIGHSLEESHVAAWQEQAMTMACDILLSPSKAVAEEINRSLPEGSPPVVAVPLRAHMFEALLQQDPREVLQNLGIQTPFCLAPDLRVKGGAAAMLHDAWQALGESGQAPPLVVTAVPNDEHTSMASGGSWSGVSIRMLRGVTPDQHLALLRMASLVVFPEDAERWSPALEEARMLGRPLLIAETKTYLEQASRHEGATFFKPVQKASLVQAFRSCWPAAAATSWTLAEEQEAISAYGETHAQHESPAATGDALLQTLQARIQEIPQEYMAARQPLRLLLHTLLNANQACEADRLLAVKKLEDCARSSEARLETIQRYQRELEAQFVAHHEQNASQEVDISSLRAANLALRLELDKHHHPLTAAKVAIASTLKRLGLSFAIKLAGACKRRLRAQAPGSTNEESPTAPINSPLVNAFTTARALCAGTKDHLADATLAALWPFAATLQQSLTPQTPLVCPAPTCRGRQVLHMLSAAGLPATTPATSLIQWLRDEETAMHHPPGALLLDVVSLTPAAVRVLAKRAWPGGVISLPLIVTGETEMAGEILREAGVPVPQLPLSQDLAVYLPEAVAAQLPDTNPATTPPASR